MTDHHPYVPARWLPGAHAMTVYASVARLRPHPPQQRERWELPDGDFLDIDRTPGPSPAAPVLVVLHGLEGSSRAPYVRGLVAEGQRHGLGAVAVNFRGCSGEENRLPRFYHSGETGDLAHVVGRLAQERPGRPIVLCGFSLGGNVTAKWLGERGDDLPGEVRGAVAISPPFDLNAAAGALDAPGFWNLVYRERFLRQLRGKALAKAPRFPGVFDVPAIRAARTFAAFDGVVTARLHGYASAEDYWFRCSSGRFLPGVRRPLLALVASNDPIAPLDEASTAAARANPAVRLEVTRGGGHVGFVEGSPLSPSYWAEQRAVAFLAAAARR